MSKVLGTVGKVAGLVATVATVAAQFGVPYAAPIALLAGAASPVAAVAAPIGPRPAMTAINIFEDGRRAFLAVDSGVFDVRDGRIRQLGCKVAAWPDQHMAIAIQGWGGPVNFMPALDHLCGRASQGAMLRAIPEALRAMRAEARHRYPEQEAMGWNQTRLWIASYERTRAKPRLFAVASDGDESAPDARPFEMREIGGFATGLTPEQLGGALPRGYIANVKEDTRRILLAQRRAPMPHLNGGCGVAGTCYLYTVSRRGVVFEPILRFPEGVGEIADPAAPGKEV